MLNTEKQTTGNSLSFIQNVLPDYNKQEILHCQQIDSDPMNLCIQEISAHMTVSWSSKVDKHTKVY